VSRAVHQPIKISSELGMLLGPRPKSWAFALLLPRGVALAVLSQHWAVTNQNLHSCAWAVAPGFARALIHMVVCEAGSVLLCAHRGSAPTCSVAYEDGTWVVSVAHCWADRPRQAPSATALEKRTRAPALRRVLQPTGYDAQDTWPSAEPGKRSDSVARTDWQRAEGTHRRTRPRRA
jgi:hypothetical protein